MKIIIAGYGKMGHQIEETAVNRGHTIVARLNSTNPDFNSLLPSHADVAIEFTNPGSAPSVISSLLDLGIPVVSGTTGWNDRLAQLKEKTLREKRSFFYASNFSLGMNLFMKVNRQLASALGNLKTYEAAIHEIHHVHKKDAPSGTAISLAEQIIDASGLYSDWSYDRDEENKLTITSERIGEIPGTHRILWHSEADSIELIHTAHNRKGFALGAVLAAEWLAGKTGFFGMNDLLSEIVEK